MTNQATRIYQAADRDDFQLMRALIEQRQDFPNSYRIVLRSVALFRHEQAPSNVEQA